MYTVFSECVQTSKGKICIRAHSKTMDGQATYKDLNKAYNDSVSVSLVAASLRADLVTNKLDTNYKKSSETFLMAWSHKIMDLESIENQQVPDKDKRIWLTTALSSHRELNMAIRNATVVEMTTKATSGGTAVDMPWESFFDLVMANARMTDVENQKNSRRQQSAHSASTTPGRGGAGRGRGGRGGREGRGRGGRGYVRPAANTKNEGPKQVMKPHMQFSTDDWWSLTEAQRDAMIAFRKAAVKTTPTPTPTPIAVNVTEVTATTSEMDLKTMAADLRTLLSNSHARKNNVMKIKYSVNLTNTTSKCGSLIDGGANGGMSGADVRLLETGYDTADVSGIADNAVQNLPIVTCAGLVESTTGPIVVIMHQYAHYGKGKTIHSVNQLLQFGVNVDATPRMFGGKQRIRTSSGHVIPLHIRNGLAYMDMSPPTDHDMDIYPTVMITSDTPWDPNSIDDDYAMDDVDTEDTDLIPDYRTETVNDYGELVNRSSAECVMTIVDTNETTFSDYVDDCLYEVHCAKYCINDTEKKHTVERKELDFNRLKPNFGWMPVERVKRTLENTTQFARADNRIPMRQHYKSRFPACNVPRWNETVATDTFFSDIPAHDDGIKSHGGTTMVQLYTGVDSLLTDVFPMKLASDMVGTFEDLIRKRGAPNQLASDNAKEQTCKAVDEVLRMYSIGDFQSEPHQQHQNRAERRIQEVKKLSDGIMDKTGTPAKMWLLCLMYVVYLQNHLATESIGWKTPLEVATGQKADVSALLQFRWWEPVYYLADARTYPSESREKLGRWVGVAENQGDALTYLVLDDTSGKVIVRSNVRSALNEGHPNLRAETPAGPSPDYGEVNPTSKPILLSAADIPENGEPPRWVNRSDLKLPKFTPDELMGLTFIRETSDGQKVRAKIKLYGK